MHAHVAGVVRAGGGGATAEHHRRGGAVEFGNRDHHGRLDRREAAIALLPLLDRLEFERLGGEIRNVEPGQQTFRRRRVVVGGPAHQGEAGERDQGVDDRSPVPLEEGLDRRAVVEAGGEGGNDGEAARFEGGDHAVIMRRVPGQNIRPHQQEADPPPCPRHGGQAGGILPDPARHARMVEARLGIVQRGRRGGDLTPCGSRAGGVALHEKPDQTGDVLVGAGEPVLQRQEIGAHILGRSGNEAQDLRQLADQRHLAGGVALRAGLAAQLLQEIQRRALGPAHIEAIEAGRAHHLRGREAADHGIAMRAPRRERGKNRPHMFVEEQHRRDDDVRPRDLRLAGGECRWIGLPFGRGVEAQGQPGMSWARRRRARSTALAK